MAHLLKYNLICCSQHGFMPRKSCLTNLLEFLEEVTKLVDAGDRVDLMYLDFSCAFDKVLHQRLLVKIKSLGVVGQVADWIENWLTGCKQHAVVNGRFSEWNTSGVPQGSVLGPSLFIIFINDIDTAVDTLMHVMKFADDTKTCCVANNLEDCHILQQQLNKLFEWSIEWQMLFNMDKCKVIHLGHNNLQYNYTIKRKNLKKTEFEKTLEYIFTNQVVKKANQVLRQLLRAVSYRGKWVFVRLYKQQVRCHLEYAVQCWNLWLKQDINLLEGVQKRAVRSIQGLHGSYEEKLQHINLPSRVDRRLRGDMIQTYKIVNRIDEVEPSTWFEIAGDTRRPTRSTTNIEDGIEKHEG